MNRWAQFRLWILAHQRWFAIWSLFSLCSLFALMDGDAAWLGCLGFLGFLFFLAPQNGALTPNHTHERPGHTDR
jgi:hypothetical protein